MAQKVRVVDRCGVDDWKAPVVECDPFGHDLRAVTDAVAEDRVHTKPFGALQAVMTTAYGQALMVKVLVVGAAIIMAVLRRRRIEFGLLLAVVAAAAVLAALPPPR